MTQEQHFDVASYALGVLDDHDAARFEDHLVDCPQCAYELESLVGVADLLGTVDAGALIAAERSERDGALLNRMLHEVKVERRRANSRRLYSLAAAVVVFTMLSIGALFAGAHWLAPEQPEQTGQTGQPAETGIVAQRGSGQLDPLPRSDGTGVGGAQLPGEHFGGTDPRTSVSADVGLERKEWGTQISFAVANLKGPRNCRLVVVHTDGTSEPLVSWSVGEQGWGTAANPRRLLLQAMTATPRDDIAHVQIQGIATDGATETLVRVP